MIKKIGVLLVNLGSPDNASNGAVFSYLNEFLTDGRVIDYPVIPRNLLVRGIIVPFRYKNSARTYREIWTKDGSPLIINSKKLLEKVKNALGENYVVELSMRYKNPSIEKALDNLKMAGVHKIIVFPLYPQYASSSTGSSHQKVLELVSKWDQIPNISLINSYYNHPLFIDSLIDAGKKYDVNDYDHVVFSYHGLPERHLRNGDVTKTHCLASGDCCATITHKNQFCYRAQCYNTTQLLAEKLNLPKDKWTFAFQSRLGKEPWLQPYTWDTLSALAKAGKKKVLVYSPAFVADCLETIFEIKEEYFELFKEQGGEVLQLVESLNDNEKWVDCVTTIIKENE